MQDRARSICRRFGGRQQGSGVRVVGEPDVESIQPHLEIRDDVMAIALHEAKAVSPASAGECVIALIARDTLGAVPAGDAVVEIIAFQRMPAITAAELQILYMIRQGNGRSGNEGIVAAIRLFDDRGFQFVDAVFVITIAANQRGISISACQSVIATQAQNHVSGGFSHKNIVGVRSFNSHRRLSPKASQSRSQDICQKPRKLRLTPNGRYCARYKSVTQV